MRTLFLAVLLFFFSMSGASYGSPIRADFPQSYTVKEGDTLWDISNTFLESPWLWPEIWHANPKIHNPHLIFPGDMISMVYIDGQPRITVVNRGLEGRTIKLNPKIKTLPAESAIPAIPLTAIESYLKNSRIFNDLNELEKAPYVFASADSRVASVKGDRVYARGSFAGAAESYEAFREGQSLTDPDSGENLGYVGYQIAELDVTGVNGDIATLQITSSQFEVKAGDRLLREDHFGQVTTFFPRAPDAPIDAKVIANLSKTKKISRFDAVVINRGQRESLRQGDILAVYKHVKVTDKFTKQRLSLPPQKVGLVMIYRPYEKLSYGIVLSATQDIEIGDQLKSP